MSGDDAVSIVADTLRNSVVMANFPADWPEKTAKAVVDALGGPRKVETDAELAALPDGSVIWYWVTYDGVEIHQQLMKHSDWWRNANDPDDAHEYFPTTERLDITLLRSGWVREPAEENRDA